MSYGVLLEKICSLYAVLYDFGVRCILNFYGMVDKVEWIFHAHDGGFDDSNLQTIWIKFGN